MLIHPGHLALFRAEMNLEFASIKGIKNKFFGDSLLLAEIHGPGHIWLQSMTPAKLAAAIEPYLPDRSSGSSSGNDNWVGPGSRCSGRVRAVDHDQDILSAQERTIMSWTAPAPDWGRELDLADPRTAPRRGQQRGAEGQHRPDRQHQARVHQAARPPTRSWPAPLTNWAAADPR